MIGKIFIISLMLYPAFAFSQPEIVWQACFGGSGDDFFTDAAVTSDNGFIATLESTSTDGDLTGHTPFPGWVMKFDSDLNVEWQKFYNSDKCGYSFYRVEQLPNGNFIFGCGGGGIGCPGNQGSADIALVETTFDGEIIWSRLYGSPGDDLFENFTPTEDGGYLITGSSYSSGGNIPFHYGGSLSTDAIVLKIDNEGNLIWLKVLGGSSYDKPLGNPIERSRGVYHIQIGSSSSDHDFGGTGIDDLKKRMIIEIDSEGNILNENFISAEDDILDFGGEWILRNDTVLLATTGNSSSSIYPTVPDHQGTEGAIVYFNNSLEIQSMKQWGGSGDDFIKRVERDNSGNYYLLGTSTSQDYDLPDNYNSGDELDYWLLKTD